MAGPAGQESCGLCCVERVIAEPRNGCISPFRELTLPAASRSLFAFLAGEPYAQDQSR